MHEIWQKMSERILPKQHIQRSIPDDWRFSAAIPLTAFRGESVGRAAENGLMEIRKVCCFLFVFGCFIFYFGRFGLLVCLLVCLKSVDLIADVFDFLRRFSLGYVVVWWVPPSKKVAHLKNALGLITLNRTRMTTGHTVPTTTLLKSFNVGKRIISHGPKHINESIETDWNMLKHQNNAKRRTVKTVENPFNKFNKFKKLPKTTRPQNDQTTKPFLVLQNGHGGRRRDRHFGERKEGLSWKWHETTCCCCTFLEFSYFCVLLLHVYSDIESRVFFLKWGDYELTLAYIMLLQSS